MNYSDSADPTPALPRVFRIGCHLESIATAPATLLYNFRARANAAQRIRWEKVTVNPAMPTELVVTEADQNRFDRLKVYHNQTLVIDYEAEVEVTHQLLNPDHLRKISPAQLGPAELPFLLPSRYCQSDLLGRFAWQKFGQIVAPYDQVLAVTDWIYENIEYLPGSTTSATSAYDTVTQCAGVCRDFAHLGVALCRALTIPARYFTGYAYRLDPPDFHACLEVFIGGRWVLFDPTRLAPRNGLVSIGAGRDAADVSVCTAFGMVQPGAQSIRCEILDGEMDDLSAPNGTPIAVSLESPTS